MTFCLVKNNTKKLLKNCLSFVIIASFINSCASSPHYIKTEVVNNSERTNVTPEWVLKQEIVLEEGANVVFVHKVNLSASSRPDACISIARTQGVGEMMKYIKNAVTTSGQVEELNASADPSYSALTAFLSQGNISGSKVTKTYWEQTMEGDETGVHPVKKLMCAVQVSIEKATLDKQMREAINGTPGGNPEIRKKLLDAQKSFIDNVGKTETSSNTPASGTP